MAITPEADRNIEAAKTLDPNLVKQAELIALYGAIETEVFENYFFGDFPRTKGTDLSWLRRQCYKEAWGSGVSDERGLYLGPAMYFIEAYSRMGIDIDPQEVYNVAVNFTSELGHYAAFYKAYRFLGGDPFRQRDIQEEQWGADWSLQQMRNAAKKVGPLGQATVRLTEGGNSSLYVILMRLAGRGGIDDLLAEAGEKVYSEEQDHMREGLVNLHRLKPSPSEWDKVRDLTVPMLRQRVNMRNEQFGFPLSSERISTAENGNISPMRFDFVGLREALSRG